MSVVDYIQVYEGPIQQSPEEAGFDAGQLTLLDDMFSRLVREKQLQCASYCLSRNGKVFTNRSMGIRDGVTESGDMKPDTIRRIASITKAFTSVAIMQLIEDGLLYRWQPVASIIEEFNTDTHRRIEISHLLTHTSGLPADGGYFHEPYPMYRYWPWDEEDWIKSALAGPLQAKPGTAWNYCSIGFTILGEIISRLSGMPYHEYVRFRIIEPLGLKRTFFEVPAELHGEVCVTDDWSKDVLTERIQPNDIPRSGGGLYSTPADLAVFADMLLHGGESPSGARILGRKTVEAMLTNYVGDKVPAFHWGDNLPTMPYGLGLKVYPDGEGLLSPGSFSHEGAGRAAMYADPVEKLTAVWFVPTTVDWVAESLLHPKNIIWAGLK